MLLIAAASLVPLTMLGLGATSASVDQLTRKSAESQARSADQLASEIDLWLHFQVAQIAEQVDAFQVARLNDRKLSGFQRLVFQQINDVHIVGIFNSDGAELSPSLFLAEVVEGSLEGKEVVSDARFSAFKNALPTDRMTAEFTAWAEGDEPGGRRPIIVGRPYAPPDSRRPVIPVVIPASPTRPMFLAVELSLDRINARFSRAADDGLDVALLDASGATALERGTGLIDPEHFRIFQPESGCSEVRYAAADGSDVLAACAPVAGTGWLVVVAEPMRVITRAGDEIRNRTGFISVFAAILSVLFGLLFSVGVAQRVTRIRDAALAVAEGELGRTVGLDGSSEIRDLSRAFNFMSRRLSANQDRLTQQQDEIATFNQELQRRLAEQEVELTEAHRLLLQSSRLVAVGEMGAGLAHELNNPLAGILGLIQVLQMKASEADPKLAEIEAQVRRCTKIVEQLTSFTRESSAVSQIDDETRSSLLLREILDDVTDFVKGPFAAVGVEVITAAGPEARLTGNRVVLSGALIQLANSLRAGCQAGGALEIFGGESGDVLEIVFRLTGSKIDRTSDDWMAAGMGFWLARKVIAQHGGALYEPPDLSAEVVSWTIRLPQECK